MRWVNGNEVVVVPSRGHAEKGKIRKDKDHLICCYRYVYMYIYLY